MGLVLFLDINCSHEFIGGTHSFISIVQVCRSRTFGNKDQCVKQIIKYIEQGEL